MMGTVWGRWSQGKLSGDGYGDKSDPELALSSLYNPKN